MDFKSYHLRLPMPPSLNAAYMPVARRGHGELIKTPEAREWELADAAGSFRHQFPQGVKAILEGRVQSQYIYNFAGNHGQDIFNYEKLLSDFLQGKMIVNDRQIDIGVVRRRINPALTKSFVDVYLNEIPDERFVKPLLEGGW